MDNAEHYQGENDKVPGYDVRWDAETSNLQDLRKRSWDVIGQGGSQSDCDQKFLKHGTVRNGDLVNGQ